MRYYNDDLQSKIDRFFEKLEKFYPEHKVFALDSIDKDLRERLNDLYKSAQYLSAEIFLAANGYEMISGDAVKSIRNTVLYTPGNEPEIIKGKVESMLRRLEEYYPDHIIPRGLQTDHKQLAKSVSGLYQWLGYADAKEMLTAYGFEVQYGEGGRPQTNDYNSLIEMFHSHFNGEKKAKNVSEIIRAFQDEKGKIKTLQNKAKDIFGTSLAEYLIKEGIMFANDRSSRKLYHYFTAVAEEEDTVLYCFTIKRQLTPGESVALLDPKSKKTITGRVLETHWATPENELPCPVNDMLEVQKTYHYFSATIEADNNTVYCYTTKRHVSSDVFVEMLEPKTGKVVTGHVIETHWFTPEGKMPCPIDEMYQFVRCLEKHKYLIVSDEMIENSFPCAGPFPNGIFPGWYVETSASIGNDLIIGKVLQIASYTFEAELPCPLSQMRHFVRRVTKDEEPIYLFCSVQIQGRSDCLYYTSPFKDIAVGDIVLVNHSWYGNMKGVVKKVERVSKKTAPFSVGRTKPIEKILQSKAMEEARIKEKTAAILQSSKTVPFAAQTIDPEPDRQFNEMTYFASAVFRGLESEVNRALQSLNISVLDTEKLVKDCGHGISQFQCVSTNVPQIIRDFPNLKGICFAEDWNRNNVYLAYSESGYAAVTSLRLIGSCDFYMRDRWTLIHDPAEKEFRERTLQYAFEEMDRWETYDYVLPDGKTRLAGEDRIPAAPYPKKRMTDPCAIIQIRFPENERFDTPEEKHKQQAWVGIPEQLSGKTFVVTGELVNFPDRDALKQIIAEAGGKLTGSVSSRTTALITNDPYSGTTKNRVAKQLGIQVINEQSFINRYLIKKETKKPSGPVSERPEEEKQDSAFHVGSYEEYICLLKNEVLLNKGKQLSDAEAEQFLAKCNLSSDWGITLEDVKKDMDEIITKSLC